jgi:hypothetical protein
VTFDGAGVIGELTGDVCGSALIYSCAVGYVCLLITLTVATERSRAAKRRSRYPNNIVNNYTNNDK